MSVNQSIFNLKGFKSVHDPTVSNEILDGIVEFFDWGLLQKENFFNVDLGETNRKGVDVSKLNLSKHKGFTEGTAWDGVNSNWVWQHGIESQTQPNVPSGIYLNDSFLPLDSPTNPYHIDYYNGRVVFDDPIPSTSKVQVEHSYKWISVDYANSIGVNKTFQEEQDELPPELTVKLPVIAVEVVNRTKMSGYELGGGQLVETMVLFHCIAQDEPTKNRMMDIVTYQNEKSIFTFDSVKIAKNDKFPLDYRGSVRENAMNFEELVTEFPRYKIRFFNVKSNNIVMKQNSLFGATVKLDVELIKHDI